MINRTNILASVDKAVKDEINKGNIPLDSKWAIVTAVDNEGAKLLAAVNFKAHEGKIETKIQAIWEHDWDGDDTFVGQVVFSGK